MEPLVGRTLGQFELRKLLGMGGMGAVYEGYQPSLQRSVAVKVIFSTPDQQASNYDEQFVREARMAAMLEHSHIVPVYDYGIERGISYVVMRLLKGGTLAGRLESDNTFLTYLALNQALQITEALASALFYAHQRGVIHRDVKANNVMFDDHGTAMLVDFGLAKVVGKTTSLTISGRFAGTPDYMAPEQWRGDAATPAIDQYALAILAYEMLTGERVFKGDSHYEMMHKHTQESPVLTEGWRDDLPEAMIPVLARALRKDPKTRYPNINMFAQALSRAAETSSSDSFVDTSPVTEDRHKTIILSEEAGVKHSTERTLRGPVIATVAVVAAMIGIIALLPGLTGGASATSDTPSPTAMRTEITPDLMMEIPAGIALTDGPTATITSSSTPTMLPTDTATTAPSVTNTMTATSSPTATETPTNPPTWTPVWTATPSPVVIAQVSCDQMDVNDDGIVNILDLRIVAAVFGSENGDANFESEFDYNHNAIIDESDLQRIVSQYDRRCS